MTVTIWWTVAALMVIWILGVAFNVGPVVHTLLALAAVLAITNLVTGRTRI